MKFTWILATVLVAMIAAAGSAEGAAAATTEIGAVAEIRDATRPTPTAEGGNVVQIAEAAGSTYAVPAGYGTITSWRHSAGGSAGTLTFKVYRPTGALREFLVIAADTRAVTASTVQSFPVQIPVRPGDRIGLSSEDLQLVYETFNPADKLGFFDPDPPAGTTKATDGEPFPEFKLDVAATLTSTPINASEGSAASPSAAAPGGSPTTSSRALAVTGLRVAPTAFAAARSGPSVTRRRDTGARVSFSVNADAAVGFTVRRSRPGRRQGRGDAARCVAVTARNRGAARCTRSVRLAGGFTQTATEGVEAFRFSGRLAGRSLGPGAYTLVATPRAGSRRGTSAMFRFRVTR